MSNIYWRIGPGRYDAKSDAQHVDQSSLSTQNDISQRIFLSVLLMAVCTL
jgi:hypothetical protein